MKFYAIKHVDGKYFAGFDTGTYGSGGPCYSEIPQLFPSSRTEYLSNLVDSLKKYENVSIVEFMEVK